jgi:hypothetical protein
MIPRIRKGDVHFIAAWGVARREFFKPGEAKLGRYTIAEISTAFGSGRNWVANKGWAKFEAQYFAERRGIDRWFLTLSTSRHSLAGSKKNNERFRDPIGTE